MHRYREDAAPWEIAFLTFLKLQGQWLKDQGGNTLNQNYYSIYLEEIFFLEFQ